MRYYLIAGEKSGDLHASNLMKQLLVRDPDAEFRFFGGDAMISVGGEVFRHYEEMAIMGFVEVVKRYGEVKENIKSTKADIQSFRPDVLILVDFGGFNLRMAKFAKEIGIKVFYYISPKVWAWNQKRAYKIKDRVDRLFCILPFEKEFFQRFDYEVDYVGNPVLDAVSSFESDPSFANKLGIAAQEKPLLAVLPGSRRNEISKMLPVMMRVIGQFPELKPVIAGVRQFDKAFYTQFMGGKDVPVLYDETYDILNHAKLAIVTSGTATLETSLFNVPQVVCYSGNRLSYEIAKRLVKIDWISLVNLIADKEVIREFIQMDFTEENLHGEMNAILTDPTRQSDIKEGYQLMRTRLGEPGASAKTAELMVKYLREEA